MVLPFLPQGEKIWLLLQVPCTGDQAGEETFSYKIISIYGSLQLVWLLGLFLTDDITESFRAKALVPAPQMCLAWSPISRNLFNMAILRREVDKGSDDSEIIFRVQT